MTFQHTILYNNELNFSLDNTKVNMTSSGTTLAIESENEDYIQTFDTSTGFSITASLMEFSGGRLQQKDQRPANATFGTKFDTTIDANWANGSAVGTAVNGCTIENGKLKCDGTSAGKYVQYAGLNNVSTCIQTGTIKFLLTPLFTGSPTVDIGYFSLSMNPNNANNLIQLIQSNGSSSTILAIYDKNSNTIVYQSYSLALVNGVECEIAICYDVNTGATRVFKNGAQVGSTAVATGLRDSNVSYFRIGSSYDGRRSQFLIDDFVIFSTVQHTANYTPGYTIPEYIYAETRSVAPKFQHGLIGTIIAANSFTTVESGGCGFSVNILPGSDTFGYFNGVDWVDSNGTYAQSTTQPIFDANLIDESVYGANSAQFAIHMPAGNTQHWIDTMTLNVLEQIGYFTTNPFVIELTEFLADQIFSITEVSTISGSDDIRNVINIDGTNYWIDTGDSSLKVSTGYLESNSMAEINSNIALINALIALGEPIKLGKYLHSGDGTSTPTLISNIINYSFFGGSPAALPLCTVWGYTRDSAGVIAPNITVKATLKKAVEIGDSIILKGDSSVTSDANGYFEIDLPQTVSYLFSFINSSNAVLYKETVSIPVATDKNYDDL